MRANGRAVKSYEIPALSQLWETMKDWVRNTLTPERRAEVILTVGTLMLLGYFAFVSYQSLQHYTIAGFSNSISFGLRHLNSIPLFGG